MNSIRIYFIFNDIDIGISFKNMPPCHKVLMNKIKRTRSVTRMIKTANENFIKVPAATDGYFLDENQKFAIEYFAGHPYPSDIIDFTNESLCDNNNSPANDDIIENEFDCELSSSDDESDEEEAISDCD